MSLRRRLLSVLTGGIARNILTLCRLAAAITFVLCLISVPFRLAQDFREGSAASPKYQAQEIHLPGSEYSSLYAVNQRGDAVGIGWDDNESPLRPFVWRDGKATALPLPPDCTDAVALDINNRGAIVGAAFKKSGEIAGLLWENGKMTVFGITGRDVAPQSINEAGVIAGVHAEPG